MGAGRNCGGGAARDPQPKAGDPVMEKLCLRYSTCQKPMKQEDILFVHEEVSQARGAPAWSLYCLCDGRKGTRAAVYVRNSLWRVLGVLLPRSRMPEYDSEGFDDFSMEVRTAIVEAFVHIGQQFRADFSGTSVTAALLCGRLLTVANVGDSDAVVDTGTDLFLATVNHRIERNPKERERLSEAGVQIAPLSSCLRRPAPPGEKGFGPLRCWPGGLAVARSLGDIRSGIHILPYPHVSQVILPQSGARLLMGSDGLWDMIHWEEAAQITRRTPVKDAATKIITEALFENNWSLSDDASALVLDVLPLRGGEFPKVVKRKLRREQQGKRRVLRLWCLGSCFTGSSQNPVTRREDLSRDKLRIVANVDGWELAKQNMVSSPKDSFSSLTGLGCGFKTSRGEKGHVRRTSGRRSGGVLCVEVDSVTKRLSSQRSSSSWPSHHSEHSATITEPLDKAQSSKPSSRRRPAREVMTSFPRKLRSGRSCATDRLSCKGKGASHRTEPSSRSSCDEQALLRGLCSIKEWSVPDRKASSAGCRAINLSNSKKKTPRQEASPGQRLPCRASATSKATMCPTETYQPFEGKVPVLRMPLQLKSNSWMAATQRKPLSLRPADRGERMVLPIHTRAS